MFIRQGPLMVAEMLLKTDFSLLVLGVNVPPYTSVPGVFLPPVKHISLCPSSLPYLQFGRFYVQSWKQHTCGGRLKTVTLAVASFGYPAVAGGQIFLPPSLLFIFIAVCSSLISLIIKSNKHLTDFFILFLCIHCSHFS